MATAHKSRVLDMTQGDPFRLVLQFSMPLFCSNLLQQLYNLTDTALAGHLLGSAALAEIGATAALYGLIMNFAFGMNNGLALTVSRYFGAGDESGIRRAVTGMFWAGLSMGLMSAIYNLGSVALQSSINALGSVYITAQTAARRLAELYFIPGGALGIGVATFSSQNLGAGRRSRIWQSVKAALAIYFVWWVFVMAFTFLLGGAAIRGITGSTDEVIISNALLYLKISAPVIPPMAVLVILRNMLQGIRHTVEPLLASGLELVGKVIFAVWLVPVQGYRAVCFCEPTTWVVCFVFILLAVWRCRGDLRDAEKI